VTHRDVILGGVEQGAEDAGENVASPGITDAVLAAIRDAGLVLMPAEPTPRLRHEAAKAGGITAGAFAAMWKHLVAHARTLER